MVLTWNQAPEIVRGRYCESLSYPATFEHYTIRLNQLVVLINRVRLFVILMLQFELVDALVGYRLFHFV